MKIKLSNCPHCGGGSTIYFDHEQLSAFVACDECGCRSKLVHKGAEGVEGMCRELQNNWNSPIFMRALAEAESLKNQLNQLNEKLDRAIDLAEQRKLSDADWMARCYEKQPLRILEERTMYKPNIDCFAFNKKHPDECKALTEMLCMTRGSCPFYKQ